MGSLVKALLACVLGLIVGLWSTERALQSGRGFDETKIGPWRVSEKVGAGDADPYARAALARSGEIPLALGEGLSFVANSDDNGAALDARCAYSIGRATPPARYWTLGIVDRKGFPIDNPAARYGFRSSEIVRAADGGFVIAISAQSHPGNWLPIGAPGRFQIVLRLYDSPVSATAGAIEKKTLPGISREGCA